MIGWVRDMIIDPEKTGRLHEVISEGEYYEMQTFDQALLRHFQAGRVSMEDALRVASSPHDFKLLVSAEGRTATSMDDIVETRESAAGPVPRNAPAPRSGPPPPGSPRRPPPSQRPPPQRPPRRWRRPVRPSPA